MSVFVKDGGAWHEVVPAAGLPGLGGWADITAVTGNPKRHAYTDADGAEWIAFEWTGDGSVTTTAGLIEALVVGAGSGSKPFYGSGGAAQQSLQMVTATTTPITVAAHVTAAGQNPLSTFGAFIHCGSGQDSTSHGSEPPGAYRGNDAGGGGGGARGAGSGATYGAGFTSSIKDGTPIEYAHGASSSSPAFGPNTGCGGKQNQPGADGVVIARVPKDHVKATGGWV